MASREIIVLPDKRLRLVSKPVAKVDESHPQAGRGHVRDHVCGARHRACRDPDRRAEAGRDPRPRQEGRAEGAAGLHQSGDHLGFGREGASRGRLPVDPGILRGGRAAGRGEGEISRSRGQAAGDRGRRACSRPACSTRSTISTACYSSIICRSSSATASSRNSPRRQGGEERSESAEADAMMCA